MSSLNSSEITAQSYNESAQDYVERTKKINMQRQYEKFSEYIQPGAPILEIGCGPGRDAKWLTEKNHLVVGIDISEKMLELARENAPNAFFFKMNYCKMSWPDELFCGLWANATLVHAEKKDFQTALSECYRVLKPNSPMYASLKQGAGEGFVEIPQTQIKRYFSYYTAEEAISHFQSAGFKILHADLDATVEKATTNKWMDFYLQKPG